MKKSDIKPIDGALKTHYASKSLSNSQLDQLMTLQPNESQASELNRFLPDFSSYRYAFYTTACLLLITCSLIAFNLINKSPLSQRIMDEIAYNHTRDMPIEVTSNSLDDIGKHLSKLSFPIILPSALTKPKWQLLGGRYCSINGKLAAQLKIKNLDDNTIYTLYQAAIDEDTELPRETHLTQKIDGVDVSIWQEKGLLMGLASSP